MSGFRGYATTDAVPTTLQILNGEPPANSARVVVDTLPGHRYRYSGGGYVALQQLIADVSGQPYADYLRDTLLLPLGMPHSTFAQPLPAFLAASAAAGHAASGAMVPGQWRVYPELGPAGLWSTPSDLARFAIALGKAPRGESDLLRQDLAQQMATPHASDPDQGTWGLGVQLIDAGTVQWLSHGGGNAGYRCRMLVAPETGQGVIVMTNSDSGGELIHEILASLGKAYGWPGFGG